jgi:hypothetical protein
MLLVGVIPAVVYGVLALLIPESPQYLLRKQRDDEALGVVRNVTGASDPEERLKEIKESLENRRRSSYRPHCGSPSASARTTRSRHPSSPP